MGSTRQIKRQTERKREINKQISGSYFGVTGTEKWTKKNTGHARGRVFTSLPMTIIVKSVDAYITTPPFDKPASKLQEITNSTGTAELRTEEVPVHFYEIPLYYLDRIAKEVKKISILTETDYSNINMFEIETKMYVKIFHQFLW